MNYFLKNFYFYKSIRIERFLNSILHIGDIEKYLNRNRMIEIIIEVLFNISFISGKKFVNLDSKFVNEFLFEITEDNLKEKIIQFCLNSLKSFINIFKQILNKKVTQETTYGTRSMITPSPRTLNASMIQDNPSLYTLSRSDISQNMNLKTVTTYIKNFLSLLSVYFLAIPQGAEKDKEKLRKYSDFSNILLDMIYDMKIILKLKPSLITAILYFIIKTKGVFLTLNQEVIVKYIFLVLSLGWPYYENEIHKYFCENFNVKLKKFNEQPIPNPSIELKRGSGSSDFSSGASFSSIINNVKINDNKKEYIYFLADVAALYYFEHFQSTKTILKIFTNVFRQRSGREKIFVDMIKWNIFSKSNRDNLKSDYRGKIYEHSQTYLGKR